jgi:CheY-like chemotaxis protein
MTRILVVEDEAPLCKLLAVALRDDGHEVITAENGFEALDKAREAPPNLVLLDLIFPEMDAETFVEHYRQLPGCADSPIIVMSATYRGAPVVLNSRAFLPKPFDLDQLLATVRELAPT